MSREFKRNYGITSKSIDVSSAFNSHLMFGKIVRRDFKDSKSQFKSLQESASNRQECPFAPLFCKDQDDKHHVKIIEILMADSVNINILRNLAWNGLPECARFRAWQILSGFLSTNNIKNFEILGQKRIEYKKFINSYYQNRNLDSNSAILRQIVIDIPRTFPLYPIFQREDIQKIYERILYLWAIRHPASSYVQGINDLIGPFLYSALFPYFGREVFTSDVTKIDSTSLEYIEADCFWLLTKLLDKIIDNYTPDQPGIQIKIIKIKKLIELYDVNLYNKLLSLSLNETFFLYKWINNLFVRDLSFKCVLRIWDTLWAEKNGFDIFIIFLCGAFIKEFKNQINEFNDHFNLIMFFQDLPISQWDESRMNEILAQSYVFQTLYNSSISRYK